MRLGTASIEPEFQFAPPRLMVWSLVLCLARRIAAVRFRDLWSVPLLSMRLLNREERRLCWEVLSDGCRYAPCLMSASLSLYLL